MGIAEGQIAQTIAVSLSLQDCLQLMKFAIAQKKIRCLCKCSWNMEFMMITVIKRVFLVDFPMRATNPANGDDYYGWADYWGIWVDTYGRASFDPTSANLVGNEMMENNWSLYLCSCVHYQKNILKLQNLRHLIKFK